MLAQAVWLIGQPKDLTEEQYEESWSVIQTQTI